MVSGEILWNEKIFINRKRVFRGTQSTLFNKITHLLKCYQPVIYENDFIHELKKKSSFLHFPLFCR